MNDFKINYDKLQRLPMIKFHYLLYLIILLFIILIYIACQINIERKITCYGMVENELIKIEINEKLSDKIKSGQKLIFSNRKMNYKVVNFGNYQIIDNNIIEEIKLEVDKYVYENEVSEVTIIYDRQKIIEYILELFK